MPAHSLSLQLRAQRGFITAALSAFVLSAPRVAVAQLIQIKTLPIADGDQWRFFPSANVGLGGVSIALRDSLLDPFENPAKGARLSERSKGLFFGSPTVYSVSKNAGGGRTFPFGGIVRSGSMFGGLAVAVQEIDAVSTSQNFVPPVPIDVVAGTVVPTQTPTTTTPSTPSRQNRFAFATLGREFTGSGVSVGASALWSGLNDVDGVDLLYSGSSNIQQHGDALDVRLSLLKEWAGNRSLEATVLHDRFGMTHDVTWLDAVWDPNTRIVTSRARVDHNLDRTNTWGLHLGYSQPLADSGWRIGAIMTTNLMTHPKLPDYQITQVMVIPWDPGHSAAYDLGVGLAKTQGLTTFGVDAIFEPIRTHTWGETPAPIVTPSGTIPAGGKTTENHFQFSNAILRTGLGQEIPFDTLRGSVRSMRLELGLALRSIDYTLHQLDHVAGSARDQRENWMEWTPTWGFGLRFSDLVLRYNGHRTTGTGRPGVFANDGPVFAAAAADGGRNFISAPNGPTTLTNVSVTTHQISVSVPIR
jgi:hypothetical protein